MENELKTYGLIQFSTKSGKIKTVMTAHLSATLKLYALNKCTATQTIYVLDLDEKKYLYIVRGRKDNFPSVFDAGKYGNYPVEQDLLDLFVDEELT